MVDVAGRTQDQIGGHRASIRADPAPLHYKASAWAWRGEAIALARRPAANRIREVSILRRAAGFTCWLCEERPLLTESEVQRSFRNLFKTKDVPPDTFEKAEALLDELRSESPLRHRLSLELEEIRKLHTAKV